MAITAIVGEQRGDEGKGRYVDMLAADHDIVARYNGGPNAGHSVVLPDGTELDLHGIPSGIAHPHVTNVIGKGALINADVMNSELQAASAKGIDLTKKNLKIDNGAHLILPHHVQADIIREGGEGSQGTTKSGIAQCAADKYMRIGVRAEIIKTDPDKLFDICLSGLMAQKEARQKISEGLDVDIEINETAEAAQYVAQAKKLGRYVTDAAFYLNNEIRNGKKILAEGAQAFLLDIDHGMYPYVTSSSTTVGGIFTGLGIPPQHIERVIGVTKGVQSHVGGGPFVTEIRDEDLLAKLHGDLDQVDSETGTTTGRKRRLGYLDLPAVRRAQMINGTDEMALTKLDWIPRFGDELKVCTAYKRKGKKLKIAPDAAYKLEQSEPIYETLANWHEDEVVNARSFDELPTTAREYIHFLEDQTGTPVTMIGVGPARDQVIVR